MPRGVFGGISQALMDQMNAAVRMASAAQQTAAAATSASTDAQQQAAQAATTATQATSTAATAASNAQALSNAVANGEQAHAAINARIDALKQTLATGTAKTPLIALGATADLTVTLSRAMPNTSYQVEVQPSAALIGGMTATIKIQTTTTVTLTVKAIVAITAGSQISVITWG